MRIRRNGRSGSERIRQILPILQVTDGASRMKIPIKGIETRIIEDTLVISSESPLKILSSCILRGGFSSAKFILNHHVNKNYYSDSPDEDMQEVVRKLSINENAVGMMTAVDLENVSIKTEKYVTAVVTGGVSNALASGEKGSSGGTINIILLIDADLCDAAMVNAVIIATEAKTLALRDLDIKSNISMEIATGTSTDSIVVACTRRGELLRYAGPATALGECIGLATRKAVREAIIKQENLLPS